MKKKTTLLDVAKACGVSTYTVSSVLNNKGDIGKETTQKVREAIWRLNYNPVKNIGDASHHMDKSLAFVLPDLYSVSSEYYFRAIQVAQMASSQLSYECRLLTETDLSGIISSHSQHSPHLGFDIAIFFCTQKNNEQTYKRLCERDIPVAIIRRKAKQSGILTVGDSDFRGMQLIAEHLYENGHRHFAFVGLGVERSSSSGKFMGFVDFLSSQSLESDYFINFEDDLADELLRAIRIKKITAIVCSMDSMACSVIKFLLRSNIRVPEDVAVTGYNNDPISRQFYPEITSVNIPVEEMVIFAAESLAKNPMKKIQLSQIVEFKNELHVRHSSDLCILTNP